jgi:hypothetical protein
MTDNISKELDKIEKRLNELDNDPIMQLVHSMAEEQKKAAKKAFVPDKELR